MMPLVSIVIPCYNGETFVKEAIDSALGQTYSNLEVIVINDGSTDRSLEIIESFGGKIQIESTINQGVQLTRNKGLELATGDYIKFLDSDDVLLPDCIEKQVARSVQLPLDSKSIVYGDVDWTDSQLQTIPGYPSQAQPSDLDPVAAIMSYSPLTSCPLHNRKYLLEVGGFDPFLVNRHENDLHLRLVLAGVQFVYDPCLVYKYRQYNDQRRLSRAAYTEMGAMYYYEVLEREQKLIEQKTGRSLLPEVQKILAKNYWTYGRVVLREGFIDEAQNYFSKARQLSPNDCIVGNFPYPLLVNTLKPYWAESVMKILSSFKRT
ncbi:glycosyltransferase family 2 protein [Chamaesiphon polymorphus]|uniref:Family 2 glycosyl transferase n=1 Tax=Chamaesiphon polymorphus CCALA 037 TaxID=2107692 RepID=A0A2T1GMG1_9CYAN|nr:glycosyltransferase family A protein [Chamaesiphon polymorphus]PSB59038.1 family 2 glycosyl transferase [Chamaesiphon polymorphus CCALA 037]